MSRAADLLAVNCTACGAGLDVLGGGRVIVHVCPYCSTALDAVEGYRALRKFNETPRPDTMLEIGQSGDIFGVRYTVIGLLQLEERWGGRTWQWIDYQIFSPTHGYAWLTFEQGEVIFTRRHRSDCWLSAHSAETANSRLSVWERGRRYVYYETSNSRVIYAEGEFTWVPRSDKVTSSVSVLHLAMDGRSRAEVKNAGPADCVPSMLTFSKSGMEREVYHSVALDKYAFAESFGCSMPRSYRMHPLSPMPRTPNGKFLIWLGLAGVVLSAGIGMSLSAVSGDLVLPGQTVRAADLPREFTFEVENAGDLVSVDLRGNGSNSWATYELELTDPEDQLLFSAARGVEYYYGREGGENWSEGDNAAQLKFHAPVAGSYTLGLYPDESGIWTNPKGGPAPQQQSEIRIRAHSGLASGFALYMLALGFALLAAFPGGRHLLNRKMRMAGSDWEDED
ncbi:hypothetical protein NIT7321_02962 [Phaeobacter italicus]|jgi:hypothetical protein|uniref:DUF4178 domain-containing protein n=1 Tax=Phaeobacter italicus TaxID=481446 RepID=A0A0H5DIX7_9RHOB|nr:DUF4178 domain-containing protein [Phaeobacter italicus]CRL12090.1 hypothetical protein NIT7321_02962 [Phaeobacter italicus]